MEDDLNLSSNQYYIAVVIWVIGYTIGAVPSKCGLLTFSSSPSAWKLTSFVHSMILARTRPSIFIPVITFGWGSMAALIGIVQNQSQLIALRFFLGIFEAGFSVRFPKIHRSRIR